MAYASSQQPPFPTDISINGTGIMLARVDADGQPTKGGNVQDSVIAWHQQRMPFQPGTPTPEGAPYVVDTALEQPEGFYAFSSGMGWREQEEKRDRDTDGYYHGHFVDSIGDYLLNGPAVTTVTPQTTDTTHGINAFFEASISGTRYLMILSGRYCLQRTADTGPGMGNISKDFGAGTNAIRAAVFRGTQTTPYAFVALGSTAVYYVWDMTSATGVWTPHASLQAIDFKVYKSELWMLNQDSNGSYQVQKCLDGGTAPTWSGAFKVADAWNQCTSLEIHDDRLYIRSVQGLLAVAAGENDVDELTGDAFKYSYLAPNNCTMATLGQFLIVPLYRSLFAYDSSGSLDEIGLGAMPRNDSPVNGIPTAMTNYADWFVYVAHWNPANNTAYLMKWGTWKWFATLYSPIPKRVFVPAWQGALWEQSTQINAMFVTEVSGQPTLYFGDAAGNVGFFILSRNGPDPTSDSACRFNTTNPFQVYLPAITRGNPGIQKAQLGMELTGQNLNVAVGYRTDMVSAYANASNLENDGVFQSDPGGRLNFETAVVSRWLDVLATGTATNSTTPCILKTAVVYQALRPAFRWVYQFKMRIGSRVVNRAGQVIVSMATTDWLSFLEGMTESGPVLLITPEGRSVNALVTDVQIDPAYQEPGGLDIEYIATVQLMEQLPTSSTGTHARLGNYSHLYLSNYSHAALENL